MAGQIPNNNQQQPQQAQPPAGYQLAYIPVVGGTVGTGNVDAEIRGIIPSLDISMWETMLSFCSTRAQAQNMYNKILGQRTEQVKKLAMLELQCQKINEFLATCQ